MAGDPKALADELSDMARSYRDTAAACRAVVACFRDEYDGCWRDGPGRGPLENEKRALELYDHVIGQGRVATNSDRDAELLERASAALRASDGAGAVLEPPPGLLMSMAVRYDHGLGMPGYYDQEIFKLAGQTATHADRLRATLSTMRQIWEEVAGCGFYRPEREADYVAMRDRALGSGALPLSDGGGHGA